MRTLHPLAVSVLLSAGLAPGCDASPPLAGGDTTVIDRSSSAFDNPAANLSDADFERHLESEIVFESTFVSAPSDVNPGLGPTYMNTSCVACHPGNGRGLPVVGHGPLGTHLAVRIERDEAGPQGSPGGPGAPLRDHALPGWEPEASIALTWTETTGSYPDGATYSLREPHVEIVLASGGPVPEGAMRTLRIPTPIFGLGLLEAVPEQTLLDLADPADDDGDGISGRVNVVFDETLQRNVIGRIGWKGQEPSLFQNSAGGFAATMGVSNPLFPDEDGGEDIDEEAVALAAFYMQTLAVPMRADWDDPEVRRGERLFDDVGCAGCHVADLETGDHDIEALRDQLIHPYSDMLLHDMGSRLADNAPDHGASGTEWRTRPLWGIGVTETVLGTAAYLHDGRARTREEAVLWHGGEAAAALTAFQQLPTEDRAALLRFLGSL